MVNQTAKAMNAITTTQKRITTRFRTIEFLRKRTPYPDHEGTLKRIERMKVEIELEECRRSKLDYAEYCATVNEF